MAAFKRYEEIDAWKLGRDLVARIYQATSKDPLKKDWGFDELYNLTETIAAKIFYLIRYLADNTKQTKS